MKVILLSDVKDVGKKDEVVEVSDGYGRNFLIRRGLAVQATGASLNVLAEEEEVTKEKEAEKKAKAEEIKDEIEKIELDFFVNVGVEGKIFGSVSSKQVARALLQRHKIKVDRRKFLDNGPYNHLGVNNVKVELYKGVVANIQVVLKEKNKMQRQLPNSIDAEQAILGAMLIYPNAVKATVEYGLEADQFFLDAHKRIYRIMRDVYEDNRSIDPTILITKLQDAQLLNSVGGSEYILELTDTATTSASIKHYVEIIQDKYKMRELINITEIINAKAFSNPGEIDSIMDEAEKGILDVTRSRRSGDFRAANEIVAAVLDNIKRKSESGTGITGMKTGYTGLDRVTSGFQRGDLIVLAARPSVGKTAFALNLGTNMALLNDLPTAIFSLEMPAEQLMQRILTFKSEIAGNKLRDGTIRTNAEWNSLFEAANTVKEAKIFIDDSPMLKVSEIFSKCRKLKAEHDLGVIIIDYLQLMDSGSSAENRQQAVSEISRAFKALARELDVPVIALSQLSRAVEQRTDKRPMLSDLRESGAIEQDADIVMFLYREDYHSNESEEDNQETDVIISKHRNGSLATITLMFKKSINAFYTIAQSSGVGH